MTARNTASASPQRSGTASLGQALRQLSWHSSPIDAPLDHGDAIPLAVVERVEIVRGPAASHGLGALAGVVNIVTRQVLDGVEAAVFAGGAPDGLGQTYDYTGRLVYLDLTQQL